jgi:hypothetical protein
MTTWLYARCHCCACCFCCCFIASCGLLLLRKQSGSAQVVAEWRLLPTTQLPARVQGMHKLYIKHCAYGSYELFVVRQVHMPKAPFTHLSSSSSAVGCYLSLTGARCTDIWQLSGFRQHKYASYQHNGG